MRARTISVVALLVMLCIASFVLWNFTKAAAKEANDKTDLITEDVSGETSISIDDADTNTSVVQAFAQNATTQMPASGIIELCEAVLPGNTIDDTEVRQRGPQSLHWINELYQGDEGYLYLKYDFRETFTNDPTTLAYLKRFKAVLDQHNIQLITLILPPRTMIYHEGLTASERPYNFERGYQNYLASLEVMKEFGVIAPDLATPFRELAKTDAVYFRRDHHWTPEAARVAAKVLATELEDNSIYQELPKQAYTTVQEGVSKLDDSTYMLRVEAVCNVDIEDEPVNVYVTEKDQSDDTATGGSLFGDAPKIPVILAGTSHSAKEAFNFPGFLADELSTEVLSVAKESGGQFAGLMEYLPDETLRATTNEPSLLIWEREFQGNLLKQFNNDFRQLIPSVYGVCSDEDALAVRSVEATGGKALGIGVPKGISGTDYYLVADVADLSLRRPTAYMQYAGGIEERVLLGNPRVRPKHFFVELLGTDAGELNRLVMEFPKDVFGPITLKICKATG